MNESMFRLCSFICFVVVAISAVWFAFSANRLASVVQPSAVPEEMLEEMRAVPRPREGQLRLEKSIERNSFPFIPTMDANALQEQRIKMYEEYGRSLGLD